MSEESEEKKEEEEEVEEEEEEEEEEEDSQNEAAPPFWQNSTLAWAQDSLVQVRVDSEFADWVATEQALAYRVVVSIEERNVGVSVLELAFRTDNDKAPYRVWHF